MWVITVFETEDIRMFEYNNKEEATEALASFKGTARLSFTN